MMINIDLHIGNISYIIMKLLINLNLSENVFITKDTYRTEAERCQKMVLVVGVILVNLIG